MPTSYKVTVEGMGEAACYEGERVLVALERAQSLGQLKNLPRKLPVGCRRGGCGICRARVISGKYEKDLMSRAHISEADEAAGVVLACAIYARGDLLLCLEPPELAKPVKQISMTTS
jgi:ferredoxin